MPHRDLSQSEIEQLLRSERVVRIALDAPGERYLVPVGYVWLDRTLCFVTMEGRKTRMISGNQDVAFQVDTSARTGVFEWQSVIGEGLVEPVTDPAEIERIRPALFDRFPDIPPWMSAEYDQRGQSGLLHWFRIRPGRVSGRLAAQSV